jgi:hypothetical protein
MEAFSKERDERGIWKGKETKTNFFNTQNSTNKCKKEFLISI